MLSPRLARVRLEAADVRIRDARGGEVALREAALTPQPSRVSFFGTAAESSQCPRGGVIDDVPGECTGVGAKAV
jgi:hypothetical protein